MSRHAPVDQPLGPPGPLAFSVMALLLTGLTGLAWLLTGQFVPEVPVFALSALGIAAVGLVKGRAAAQLEDAGPVAVSPTPVPASVGASAPD